MVHDGDAMGHAVGFIHVMGGQKDSGLLRFIEALDVGPELVAALRIETERGLVKKQNFGSVQKAAGNFQPPLHAAGESLYIGVFAFPKFEELEQFFGTLRPDFAGYVIEDAMEIHVFPRSLFVVEARILKDDAKALAGLLLLDGGIESIELDLTAGGPQQRSKHLDGGGFAGSIGSQEGKYLSLGDVEADVADGGEISEGFNQMADRNHPRE